MQIRLRTSTFKLETVSHLTIPFSTIPAGADLNNVYALAIPVYQYSDASIQIQALPYCT